ncbi:TPA: hypothetical protein QH850_002770 [Enterobacter chengduensis]|nr:hypothetical protein [Enterobacter chengduensis]
MTHSAICTLAGLLFITLPGGGQAETKIDPRDPSIWHEKSENPLTQEVPCEAFSSAVCPSYDDEKSDVQRERERREERRLRAQYERR